MEVARESTTLVEKSSVTFSQYIALSFGLFVIIFQMFTTYCLFHSKLCFTLLSLSTRLWHSFCLCYNILFMVMFNDGFLFG
jgi:hypothetical protein